MRAFKPAYFRIGLVLAFAATLAACAIQLAPLYDKALVEGLTSANAETMELIASAADGTSKDTFSAREPKYSRVIGKMEALSLQAAARPVPSNNVTEAVKKIVTSRSGTGSSEAGIPSSAALHGISTTIAKMRDVDKRQGLTAVEVQAFKGQVVIYMDQALTYEAALERS